MDFDFGWAPVSRIVQKFIVSYLESIEEVNQSFFVSPSNGVIKGVVSSLGFPSYVFILHYPRGDNRMRWDSFKLVVPKI